ncbi:MAG TPA: sigma-70 family RNA polymerase sigma factor [Chloroflexota bacterium]|nr:sigma-70 family RNA polymerase sigma factor [Chloroflexota bacterium]
MTEIERLVEDAKAGDEAAFAKLVEQYRDWAVGRAVAILGDDELARDVVQEAFTAAHAGLTTLSDPAAFGGWLRTIVRRGSYRALRRERPNLAPLEAVGDVPGESAGPDRLAEEDEHRREVLAAIDRLPAAQREVILLYYWHDFSQREIAGHLDLPVTTVNNYLFAARRQLREEMQTMADEISNAASSANTPSGTVVAVYGPVVEVHFVHRRLPPLQSWLRPEDPQKPLLATVQYLMDGTVRAVAVGNGAAFRPGDEVADAGHRVAVPIDARNAREAVARLTELAHQPGKAGGTRIETGIKALDLFCPLVGGDAVGFAARPGVGMVVLIQELLIRRATQPGRLSLIAPVPAIERYGHGLSPSDPGAEAPYGLGSLQTAFLPIRDMAAPPAGFLDPVDATVSLSLPLAKLGMFPAIDPLSSVSKHLEPAVVGAEHVAVATRVRDLLQRFPPESESPDAAPPAGGDRPLAERARRLRRFLTQPFYVAAPWIRWPAGFVPAAETVRTCAAILDGAYDAIPEDAFYMANGIDEVLARGAGPA